MRNRANNNPGFSRFRPVFFLIILLLTGTSLKAGIAGDQNFQKIFRLIYQQRYAEAEREIVSSGKLSDPLHRKILMLDLKWWEAISKEEKPDFSEFESELAENVTQLKAGNYDNTLFQMIILTYSLRLSAKKGQIFSMMSNMYKINQLISQFDESLLEGHDREIYQIYKAVFLVGKSKLILFNAQLKEQGMQTLESYLTSPNIVVLTVAHYSLAKIYFEIEKSYEKSAFYFQKLCTIYPENYIFSKSLNECRL
jgi:hypothetical protein